LVVGAGVVLVRLRVLLVGACSRVGKDEAGMGCWWVWRTVGSWINGPATCSLGGVWVVLVLVSCW